MEDKDSANTYICVAMCLCMYAPVCPLEVDIQGEILKKEKGRILSYSSDNGHMCLHWIIVWERF